MSVHIKLNDWIGERDYDIDNPKRQLGVNKKENGLAAWCKTGDKPTDMLILSAPEWRALMLCIQGILDDDETR